MAGARAAVGAKPKTDLGLGSYTGKLKKEKNRPGPPCKATPTSATSGTRSSSTRPARRLERWLRAAPLAATGPGSKAPAWNRVLGTAFPLCFHCCRSSLQTTPFIAVCPSRWLRQCLLLLSPRSRQVTDIDRWVDDRDRGLCLCMGGAALLATPPARHSSLRSGRNAAALVYTSSMTSQVAGWARRNIGVVAGLKRKGCVTVATVIGKEQDEVTRVFGGQSVAATRHKVRTVFSVALT